MKLNFKIPFKKGICGIENDIFYKDTIGKIFCSGCGIKFKKGEQYYYWYPSENDGVAPIIDDCEYLLCKKCAKKRK